MEAWRRFERWTVGTLAVLFLGIFVYIAWPHTIQAPIPELGKPISISRTRGTTQAVFIMKQPMWEAYNRIDYKLRNRGFTQPPDTWNGLLTRNNTEWIRVMQGEWQPLDNGQSTIRWDPNVTTVVYSFRRPNWWRTWRRVQRDWAMRNQTKAQKAQMARMPSSIYRKPPLSN